MSSYRPHSPTFSPYSPYNPVNQQPVTSDYAIEHKPQPSASQAPIEKMSNVHEMEPLSGTASISKEQERENALIVEDSPYKVLSRRERKRVFFHALRFVLITVIVGIILCIPIFVYRDYKGIDNSKDPAVQNENLVYWLFAWFLTSWLIACFFNFIGLLFPYIFWIVAKFVNPAHRRYWRVFRPMKLPITLLGALVGFYVTFFVVSYPVYYEERRS